MASVALVVKLSELIITPGEENLYCLVLTMTYLSFVYLVFGYTMLA